MRKNLLAKSEINEENILQSNAAVIRWDYWLIQLDSNSITVIATYLPENLKMFDLFSQKLTTGSLQLWVSGSVSDEPGCLVQLSNPDANN